LRNRPVYRCAQLLLFGVIETVGPLFVDAEDLLMPGKIAGLARGRPPRARHLGADDPGRLPDQRRYFLAGRVATDEPSEDGLTTKGGDIAGNIADAAQHVLSALKQQHRHRRFR
jgi:hypothetical protein